MSSYTTEEDSSIMLGEIASIARGTINPTVCPDEEFTYYSIPGYDATGGPLEILGKEIQSNKTLLKSDCILISKLNPRIPRVCLANISERNKTICSTEFIPLVPRSESVEPLYLAHYLRSPIFQKRFQASAGGSTNSHSRVTPGEILDWEVFVPPLPEQKKIAEILSGIDRLISATQKVKVEKYRHLLNGIINQLIVFGIRGRKVIETDAGSFPENWRIGKVEDFFTLGRGRVISIPYIKEHPGPYPVFSSQSKNNGEMGKMDTHDFDGDYFTWTTDGAYAGSVFSRSGKFNCTNVCGTGKAKLSNEADPKFASYFLQRVAKDHVSYVGNPKLMNNIFAEIPFALPPIEEQHEINAIIDSAENNISSMEEQIVSLSNLKVSISSDLLSGRKRVTI